MAKMIGRAALEEMVEAHTEGKAYELWERTLGHAPVKTGFLKESIVIERTGAAKYVIDSQAPYTDAVVVGHRVRGAEAGDAELVERIAANLGEESGVKNVPPNPFMQRAIDDMAE